MRYWHGTEGHQTRHRADGVAARHDPSRRRFRRVATAAQAQAQDDRPNILLIVADDAGYADIGSFGGEIQTPNLDALAAAGVRFTQFDGQRHLLAVAVNAAQRHGQPPGRPRQHGRVHRVQPGRGAGYEGYLSDKVVPVSALLKEAGYNTFMAGKWHMGEEPEHFPAARGFMRDLSLIPGGGSHMDDMWGAKGERQLYTFNGKPIPALRPGFHSSERLHGGDHQQHRGEPGDGKPFFAYLALQAPHDPFQLPAEWRDRYQGRYDQGYDETRAARIARMKALGILARATRVPAAAHRSRLERSPAGGKAQVGAQHGTLCRHGRKHGRQHRQADRLSQEPAASMTTRSSSSSPTMGRKAM